jgi:uncharacterized protein YbjT (DUF2867 family)
VILVTGATGNVGKPLVGLLSDTGVPFRAFVRDPERGRAALGPTVALAEGDFAEPATLDAALEGVERVFLLSGNSELETDAVEASVRAGVGRVVKQSALGVGLDPPPFHRRIEETLEGSGLGFTHLRPTAFMQTLAAYLPALIGNDGTFRLPAGGGRVAWVDTRDISAVAFRALTEDGHEGKAYPITGPETLSMAEVAEKLSAATGRPIRYENVPPDTARELMVQRGLPAAFADFLVAFYGLVSEGATDFVTQSVPEVTGAPGRTFGAFAQEHASAFAGKVG